MACSLWTHWKRVSSHYPQSWCTLWKATTLTEWNCPTPWWFFFFCWRIPGLYSDHVQCLTTKEAGSQGCVWYWPNYRAYRLKSGFKLLIPFDVTGRFSVKQYWMTLYWEYQIYYWGQQHDCKLVVISMEIWNSGGRISSLHMMNKKHDDEQKVLTSPFYSTAWQLFLPNTVYSLTIVTLQI